MTVLQTTLKANVFVATIPEQSELTLRGMEKVGGLGRSSLSSHAIMATDLSTRELG